MNTDMNIPILKSSTPDLESQKVNSRPQVDIVKRSEAISDEKTIENQQEDELSSEELENVVTDMNLTAQNLQRDLLFSVDEKSGGTFVKVIDKETEEIVREIPSKEIREIKSRLEEVAGMIFQESV